jgi:hypothetical protein
MQTRVGVLYPRRLDNNISSRRTTHLSIELLSILYQSWLYPELNSLRHFTSDSNQMSTSATATKVVAATSTPTKNDTPLLQNDNPYPPRLITGPAAPSSNKGALVCTILSAYDLPAKEQPLSIALTVCGKVVTSGPPSARHKDRNSFKFSTDNTLRLEAPLSAMYSQKARLVVQYKDVTQNLFADIVVNSLKVQETSWLILNLPSKDEIPPSLRLELRLEGPYRAEIGAMLAMASSWFGLMDHVEAATVDVLQKFPRLPSSNTLLIPAVPLATALVVLSPIVLGIAIAGLPFLIPILVVVGTILLSFSGIIVALCASTSAGRQYVASMAGPAVTYVISSASGQSLVYDTGPRPTPVSVARLVLPTELVAKLLVSLTMDLIGSSSYLLPVVGEGFDLAWAPIQTILIMAMYDDVAPNLKYLSFIEEVLPFTDVVPSATIGWLTEFGPTLLSGAPLVAGGTTTPSRTVMSPNGRN